MSHIPPVRRQWLSLAAVIVIDLMVIGALAHGHPTTAGALTGLAMIQLGWIGLQAVRHDRALQALLVEANTDAVTGLPTRRLLYQHLGTLSIDTPITVAYIDVDGLKPVNDGLGHQAGDDLLAVVADRLRRACTPGDVLVRLGGDEYAIATDSDRYQLAGALADVNGDTVIGGVRVPVKVSVGICRTVGGDPQLALGSAEAAMYTAKRRGSGIEHYDATRDGPPRLIFPRPHYATVGRHRAGHE